MYYFTYGADIAAVEDVTQAIKYAAAGWYLVSRATFIAAWRARDAQVLADLPADVVEVTTREPGAVVERLPDGWVRYSV